MPQTVPIILNYNLKLNMLSEIHLKMSILGNMPVPKEISYVKMYRLPK